jgi:hypothetical protein
MVTESTPLYACNFGDKHLAFMDLDAIYFELQHFKNERSWYNLNLPRESIMKILRNSHWYRLYIPSEEMEFSRFDRVRRWEEIAVALLKKYIDRFYKHKRQEWEADHLEYHELRENDPNFVQEYRLLIDESAENVKVGLEALKDQINKKTFKAKCEIGNLSAYWFGSHLFQPLLHLSKSQLIEVSPVSLMREPEQFQQDCARNLRAVKVSDHFQAILGCLLGEDWTTPRLIEMVISPDGHLLGRCDGDPSFKAFLGASEDLTKNIHGVAPVAELDGDEIGYLVGRVAEIKRQR